MQNDCIAQSGTERTTVFYHVVAVVSVVKTPAISLMNCGPRMMKLPPRSPPPNRDDSYIIEVGQNETHEDVVRRHPDVLFIQGDVLFKQAGTGPLTVRRKEQ